MKQHRVAGLHVDVPQPCSPSPSRRVGTLSGDRHGVEVPGQQHPRRPAEVRAGQHRVADADDFESAGSAPAAPPRPRRRCAASFRDSLGMSTSAAVSAIGSPRKSRPSIDVSRLTSSRVTSASGVGVATIAADGTVLDTWFPDRNRRGRSERHRAAVGRRSARRAGHDGRARRRPRRRKSGGAHGDRRARRQAHRRVRRLPAAASAVAPPDRSRTVRTSTASSGC